MNKLNRFTIAGKPSRARTSLAKSEIPCKFGRSLVRAFSDVREARRNEAKRAETDMMQDRYRDKAAGMSPFNRIGDPKDVADAAVFPASDAARWVTGQNIGAGGGAF